MTVYYTYDLTFRYESTVTADVQPDRSTTVVPVPALPVNQWDGTRWVNTLEAPDNMSIRKRGYISTANALFLQMLSYREEGNAGAEATALAEWTALRAAIRAQYPD